MKKLVLRFMLIAFLAASLAGSAWAGCVTMTTDKAVYDYGEAVSATLYSDTCHFILAYCNVFDAGGDLVTSLKPHLISNWPQQMNYYWDQTDSAGQPVPPGTYEMVAPGNKIKVTILGTGILYAVSLRPTSSPAPNAWKIAELVEIDLASGTGTKIGATAAGLDQRQWSLDLSFGPGGTLWAVDGVSRWNNLVTINTATGAGTVQGSTGTLIEGIAFASHGLLYAADSGLNNWDANGDSLAIIDPENFHYTVVGATHTDIDGLALSPDGILYGVDSSTLLTIDRDTGAVAPIDLIGDGNFFAITFGPDGIMYGASANGDIYTIDPDTAVVSFVCSTGFPYMVGLEFAAFKMPGSIDDYIQNLPDDCFKNNADQRKNALHEKLLEVQALIDAGDYQAAIDKLSHDIRPKVDGEGKNDWITCADDQARLIAMIDALIAYLVGLI
jgi:sugar lactone lactonase YvrE